MIKNIDNSPLSDRNGEYGGKSGLKDGCIIDGDNWLIKLERPTKKIVHLSTI